MILITVEVTGERVDSQGAKEAVAMALEKLGGVRVVRVEVSDGAEQMRMEEVAMKKRMFALFLAALLLLAAMLPAACSASGWTPSAVVDDEGVVVLYAPFADAKRACLAAYTEDGRFIEARFCWLRLGEGRVFVGDIYESVGYWTAFSLDDDFCPVGRSYWSRTLSAPKKATGGGE